MITNNKQWLRLTEREKQLILLGLVFSKKLSK